MTAEVATQPKKPTEYHLGKPVHARDSQGRPICGARRSDGRVCGSTVLMANGRCKRDGGKNPSGIMHPCYKGGLKSVMLKAIPKHLQKAYLASLTDPDQISLEPAISLLDSNTIRLLQQMTEGIDRRVYKVMSEQAPIMDALIWAQPEERSWTEVRTTWEKFRVLIQAGCNEEVLWDQIQVNLEARRRLSETDQKRKYIQSKVLDTKQTDTLVLAILTIVRKHVTDTKIRGAVGREVLGLLAPREAAAATVIQDVQDGDAEDMVTARIEAANAVSTVDATEDDDEDEAILELHTGEPVELEPYPDEVIEPI